MSQPVAPLPRDLQSRLRLTVAGLRSTHRRRRFAPELHAGVPAGAYATAGAVPQDQDEAYDDGLRVEIVSALLLRAQALCEGAAVGGPLVWLTRTGPLAWHDLDAAWLGPALRAFGEAGLPAGFLVLTKEGWYDPRSGAGRSWIRLRVR